MAGAIMRGFLIATAFALAGCAATKERVTSALGDKYAGQTIDNLVVRFGPPNNSFKMASGGSSYVWEIANHTNVDVDKYGGAANTFYCRIRAVTGPDNVVTSVSTEDVSNLLGESLCAKRLGLARQS